MSAYYHDRKLWDRLASRDHSYLKTEIGDKQGHALRRNFAPKMYGPMKNKQVKVSYSTIIHKTDLRS